MNRIALCLLVITMMAFPLSSTTMADLNHRGSIVKIFTIQNRPDYYNPWAMHGPRQGTGSGAIIKGRKILTNAHVVSDQTFIQVRKYGTVKKYVARVLEVSHDTDLALLTVDDPEFFEDTEPLDFGELPESQQEVLVYGFPMGGDTLSITKGVVSRVEHQTYAHSSGWFLAGQIDAAINPGNSGGPVLVDGNIVGVVMQSMTQADNIGYMVPVNLVHHFLEDLEDGTYNGYPSMGILFQNLESPAMRKKHKVGDDQTGLIVNKVVVGSPADGILQEGDVLLELDGYDVEDDGTIEFRPDERTSISYAVQKHQVGDNIDVVVLRDGEVQILTLTLHRPMQDDWLIPMDQFDIMPTYYIYGGVVFTPLTKNFLMAWGNNWFNAAPNTLVAKLSNNYPKEVGEEVVIILKVLAADVNQGYHTFANWVVDTVDDVKVKSLEHLISLIEEKGQGREFVELANKLGQKVVLERDAAEAQGPEILDRYRIPEDRSENLQAL